MPEAVPAASLLSRATRLKTLPVFLAPVLVGAALASEQTGRFSWSLLALTLLGAGAAQLGGNVMNDHFDQRSGVDKLARIDRTAVPTGSGLIESGAMSPRTLLAIGVGLLAIALLIGVVLAAIAGPAVIAFAAIGVVLAVGYVAPPLRYGYRGHGLGEAGLFLAGAVVVVGAYYVQAERVDAEAVLASLAPGIMTMLVVFQQNFLHWRPDRAVGKWTLVAWLEPNVALVVDGMLIVTAYLALTLCVVLGIFPPSALLAWITFVPLAVAWSRTLVDPMPQTYLGLLGATLGASLLTSVVLAISLAAA